MIGREPENKRERRAEDRAREQLENRPEPSILDVVALEVSLAVKDNKDY